MTAHRSPAGETPVLGDGQFLQETNMLTVNSPRHQHRRALFSLAWVARVELSALYSLSFGRGTLEMR